MGLLEEGKDKTFAIAQLYSYTRGQGNLYLAAQCFWCIHRVYVIIFITQQSNLLIVLRFVTEKSGQWPQVSLSHSYQNV